jgi:glycosyltransferase involved in cell wall biosynthesis
MKSIAFISTMAGYPWGGSEELWSRAALRLSMSGYRVSASVTYWPEPAPQVKALAKQEIEVFVRQPPIASLPLRIWRKVMRSFREDREDFNWLRRQRPDLTVISQGGCVDGFEWAKFCHKANLPFVLIVQCNSEGWWPKDGVAYEMAEVYRSARRVFCVSQRNLQLLEWQIAESLPNGSVTWNPYNVPIDQLPSWPVNDGVWKLACVARLEPRAKGQDILFQALARQQWRERPIEVNLYGTGPWERSLRRLVEHLKLRNVHFRGHLCDVMKIWQYNHLLVLPSRYEGLPLALVEAMWCGRLAVVTDIGGNAELCIDGKTGFVIPAPATSLLDQTLERAWERRHEWQSMGRAARQHAEAVIPRDPVNEFCRELIECGEFNAIKRNTRFSLHSSVLFRGTHNKCRSANQ